MQRRIPKLIVFILVAFSLLFGMGSYEFLLFPQDTRSLSLHNAASAYDHSLLRNNPAALSMTTAKTAYSYLILPAKIYSSEIQWIRKISSGIRAGKLSYISYGNFEDDETKEKTTAYDIFFEMGYKKELKNIVSVGISGGYMLSYISGYQSQLFFTKIGVRSRMMRKRLGLGFSLENVGFLLTSYTDMKESMPAIFRTAMYYRPRFLSTIISIDVIRRLNSYFTEFSGGLEFNPRKRLTIRLGCSSLRTGFLTDDFLSNILLDVSGGAGFQFNKLNLDVGFWNLGASGYVVGFSISKKLD